MIGCCVGKWVGEWVVWWVVGQWLDELVKSKMGNGRLGSTCG